MIFIDQSELASDSRLPSIPNAKASDILERLTGADIMVSPLSMPVTKKLLPRHIDAGAVLINRKSFSDMLSSIASGSINAILARMIAAGAKWTWQRVIMSTGMFAPDLETGKVLIGEPRRNKRRGGTYVHLRGVPAGLPEYTAYATIRRRIAFRGGYYLQLTCDDEIPGELAKWEKDLKELSKVKEIWPHIAKMCDPPDRDDPLQEPRLVTDWRAPFVAMMQAASDSGGVGYVRATSLRDAILEANAEDTLFQGLSWATWTRWLNKPRFAAQWGSKTMQAVRDVLGVPDGFDIKLEVIEKE